MRFPRSSGILLHPTSLPGRYGIGDLGPEAYRFVGFLQQTVQGIWQVLPLGPTGYGDSPYQGLSVFAGNPMLISPERLVEAGHLVEADLADFPAFPDALQPVYELMRNVHWVCRYPRPAHRSHHQTLHERDLSGDSFPNEPVVVLEDTRGDLERGDEMLGIHPWMLSPEALVGQLREGVPRCHSSLNPCPDRLVDRQPEVLQKEFDFRRKGRTEAEDDPFDWHLFPE